MYDVVIMLVIAILLIYSAGESQMFSSHISGVIALIMSSVLIVWLILSMCLAKPKNIVEYTVMTDNVNNVQYIVSPRRQQAFINLNQRLNRKFKDGDIVEEYNYAGWSLGLYRIMSEWHYSLKNDSGFTETAPEYSTNVTMSVHDFSSYCIQCYRKGVIDATFYGMEDHFVDVNKMVKTMSDTIIEETAGKRTSRTVTETVIERSTEK